MNIASLPRQVQLRFEHSNDSIVFIDHRKLGTIINLSFLFDKNRFQGLLFTDMWLLVSCI